MSRQCCVGRHGAVLYARGCHAEIFLRAVEIALRHRYLLHCLLHLLLELGYLKRDHFAGVLILTSVQGSLGLGLAGLLRRLHSVEDRHVHGNAHAERSSPFVGYSIGGRGVGEQIACGESHLRHHVRAGNAHFLVIYFRGEVEAPGLRPVGQDLVHCLFLPHFRKRNLFRILVSEHYVRIEVQAYFLAQQHFSQDKSVRCLGLHHIGLIDFHLYGKCVGLGRHSRIYGSIHILLHSREQFGVVFGQFLLRRNGYNLPVGLVHGGQDVLILLVVGGAGQFLGQVGYAVRRHDFAAGEDWLLQADSGNENVVHVQMEGVIQLRSELVQCGADVSLSQCPDDGLPERTLHVFGRRCGIRYDGLLEIAHEFVQ